VKGSLVAEQAGESPLVTGRFLVAMADTDATRVIYYGTPLRWAERLVTTWLVEVGFPTSDALQTGRGLPAVHVEVTYLSPLRLDELVDAAMFLERLGGSSSTFRAEFNLEGATRPRSLISHRSSPRPSMASCERRGFRPRS
jgi:acyl-CoA thioester hydrolase